MRERDWTASSYRSRQSARWRKSAGRDLLEPTDVLLSAAGEAKRQVVNQWIRTSNEFDAVLDFDAVIRDPAHPTMIAPAFDSGDHLHPNDAGYTAMANSIDLRLFRTGEFRGADAR